MEDVVELEGIVIPDSYQSEEECEEDLKSKRPPSIFQSLMRRNSTINDIDEEETKKVDLEDKNIVNDHDHEHDDEEAKEVDLEDKDIVNDHDGEEEAKEVDLEDENIIVNDNDDDEEEAKEVDLGDKNNIVNDHDGEEEEFYMVWFDAFLAKHGFDKDYLDKSSELQEILKTWLQKKVSSAQFRLNEAQTDLPFINFRYVLCKQWLSSL